jgi:hypothetical protein
VELAPTVGVKLAVGTAGSTGVELRLELGMVVGVDPDGGVAVGVQLDRVRDKITITIKKVPRAFLLFFIVISWRRWICPVNIIINQVGLSDAPFPADGLFLAGHKPHCGPYSRSSPPVDWARGQWSDQQGIKKPLLDRGRASTISSCL